MRILTKNLHGAGYRLEVHEDDNGKVDWFQISPERWDEDFTNKLKAVIKTKLDSRNTSYFIEDALTCIEKLHILQLAE